MRAFSTSMLLADRRCSRIASIGPRCVRITTCPVRRTVVNTVHRCCRPPVAGDRDRGSCTMPTPASLTTAPHRDFELEVVSGAWPTDISGESGLLQPPEQRQTSRTPSSTAAAICRLSLEPGHPRRCPTAGSPGSHAPIQTPGKRLFDRHPDAVHRRRRSATPRRSGPPTRRTRRRCPGATGSSPPGMPGARSSSTPTRSSSWPRSATSTAGAGRSMPVGGVLPFLFSTAHPVADPERHCLWTVKLEPVMEPTFGMRPSRGALGPPRRHEGAALAPRGGRRSPAPSTRSARPATG